MFYVETLFTMRAILENYENLRDGLCLGLQPLSSSYEMTMLIVPIRLLLLVYFETDDWEAYRM